MFPSVLQELRKYFGRDFLLGVFFPVLIFIGTSLALYYEITQGAEVALATWEKLSLQTQVFSILAGLIAVTVLAALIYNFQYSLTRLFEGYWPRFRILSTLRNTRTRLYKERWDYLEALTQQSSTLTDAEKNEITEEQLIFYPPPIHLNRLMPTRIGNTLLASEVYALDRYGIDSSIIWTRLRPLLTDKAVAPLEDSRTAIDFMLLMSVFAATFTLIWCPVLALFTNQWGLFLLCALGWPLAWICYQNAVQRALDYSEQLKAIFDLYRHDLLKVLGRPIPTSAKAEHKEWRELSDFLYYNVPMPSPPTAPEKPQDWSQVATALAELLKRMSPPIP